VTGSGTTAITATVVDDSHNHIISNVDFLQDSLNAKANDSDLANYVTLSGTETITGAKTFTNTFTQSGGDANFDNNTLFVDESENRVGIGTSSPSAKLEVSGGIRLSESGNLSGRSYPYTTTVGSGADATTTYIEAGSTSGYQSRITVAAGGAATDPNTIKFSVASNESMRIDANGNVGIGTPNPSEKLDVNGKVKIQDLTGTGGNAVYENGGVLGVASDARFKTYVGDIKNGIALINQLKPKYFIDNRNSSFQQLGFYAQEVKSVINEASYPIGNTDYLGINDRAILATTVKAIQEQQSIIETQQQTITDLQTTIQSLITRIENLENK